MKLYRDRFDDSDDAFGGSETLRQLVEEGIVEVVEGVLADWCDKHQSTGTPKHGQCHEVLGWHRLSQRTADPCKWGQRLIVKLEGPSE